MADQQNVFKLKLQPGKKLQDNFRQRKYKYIVSV